MKAIGPRAKKVMDVLTEMCTHIGDHDKFHTGAYMDVVVEFIDRCDLGAMYSVAHYYKQNGDLMRDPEMCFIQGGDGEYYPYYYRLDGLGIEEEVVHWHDGSIIDYDTVRQKRQANFAESWMRNIKEQQERVI
jgi:hypothetical protein